MFQARHLIEFTIPDLHLLVLLSASRVLNEVPLLVLGILLLLDVIDFPEVFVQLGYLLELVARELLLNLASRSHVLVDLARMLPAINQVKRLLVLVKVAHSADKFCRIGFLGLQLSNFVLNRHFQNILRGSETLLGQLYTVKGPTLQEYLLHITWLRWWHSSFLPSWLPLLLFIVVLIG